MKKNFFSLYILLSFSLAASSQEVNLPLNSEEENPVKRDEAYQEYIAFFEEVYAKMDENYYHLVTREDFNKFLGMFETRIYSQLKGEGKSSNYVKWRSSAFLVDALKSPDDIFSAFFPPKPAKEYEDKVLGKKVDLGIEGQLRDEGFLVSLVQIRSDSYEKGLREGDVILTINGKKVTRLTQEKIMELLTPLEGKTVILKFLNKKEGTMSVIKVISKEYFKKYVTMIPVSVPHVFCIKIERFNRMTAEDLTAYMNYILSQGESDLIIDLRGNPGGPPLAAREISAFFLPPNEEFTYFQRKNRPKASLHVPSIPDRFHYKGDIVILVDHESGSASELFSGILQGRKRATIMGENTAGQVFLKEMFYFDDESMLLLVTARGHHPDGNVFSFKGVTPDVSIEGPPPGEDYKLIHYAAKYLASRRQQKIQ